MPLQQRVEIRGADFQVVKVASPWWCSTTSTQQFFLEAEGITMDNMG